MQEIIKYQNVKIERKGMLVLNDATFTVNSGEIVYLTGKVGSGKSSLLKSVFADIPIKSGSAMACGFNLSTISHKQIPFLRRKIGFVFQDFKLLSDRDIYSNLDFVLEVTGISDLRTRHDRVDQILAQVGLTDKSYKMPHELSGGEQQRVAVARALLNSPSLILADEPTGNLDSENADMVMRLLQQASMSGTAVLIATHNMRLTEDFKGRRLNIKDTHIYQI